MLMICWASVVVVDAATGVDGARLKRTAPARATGRMSARAPMSCFRNGIPSCQDVALGARRAMTPADSHGRTGGTGVGRFQGVPTRIGTLPEKGARGEPRDRGDVRVFRVPM